MLKNQIELIHDNRPQVLLTWHKRDADGNQFPIAFQFAEEVDEATKQRVVEVSRRPMKVLDGGVGKRVVFGSSDHFLCLPRVLARLGFRARLFSSVHQSHALEDRPIEGA